MTKGMQTLIGLIAGGLGIWVIDMQINWSWAVVGGCALIYLAGAFLAGSKD